MLCINSTHTDPFFNIAAEEYFLKNSQENIIMLYRNEPSVIIGKHQDILTEVNIKFTEKRNIKVVRRYSGGGAVFHDLGNLNISFIETNKSLGFDRFTNTMVDMLSSFGLKAEINDRKALTIGGYKVSGSAQGIYKNRVMYHATLLFSSDLASLTTSLEGSESTEMVKKPVRLSVRSVKSVVSNIADHIEYKMDIKDFCELVTNYFLSSYNDSSPYIFSQKDIDGILNLRNYKYSTQEWINYGSVPSRKTKAKPISF